MQQCCTVSKMVGQHAQENMCPREAFPHCHACAAQNSALRWARAASQRYSERPAVRQISEVSRLNDGCNKGSVNTQQDLSWWRIMYYRRGYHTWDHSDTLKLNQTWEKDPSTRSSKKATVKKQVIFRAIHWPTSRPLILERHPKSCLIWQHIAIVTSSHLLSISVIIIL